MFDEKANDDLKEAPNIDPNRARPFVPPTVFSGEQQHTTLLRGGRPMGERRVGHADTGKYLWGQDHAQGDRHLAEQPSRLLHLSR
jgi:hypothetical protein